jgi:hypothetical protein
MKRTISSFKTGFLPFISAFSFCNFTQRCLAEVTSALSVFLMIKLSLYQRKMQKKSHFTDFTKTRRHVYNERANYGAKRQPINSLGKFRTNFPSEFQ